MTRIVRVLTTIFGALLFCGVTFAQEPVVNIDIKNHSNLAQAQQHIVKADQFIKEAQKNNRYDMEGHAAKARQLLLEADKELKLAAETANAANAKEKGKR